MTKSISDSKALLIFSELSELLAGALAKGLPSMAHVNGPLSRARLAEVDGPRATFDMGGWAFIIALYPCAGDESFEFYAECTMALGKGWTGADGTGDPARELGFDIGVECPAHEAARFIRMTLADEMSRGICGRFEARARAAEDAWGESNIAALPMAA